MRLNFKRGRFFASGDLAKKLTSPSGRGVFGSNPSFSLVADLRTDFFLVFIGIRIEYIDNTSPTLKMDGSLARPDSQRKLHHSGGGPPLRPS